MATQSTGNGEAFIEANGLRFCYERFGDPARPALLLIMGLGAQMILWDEAFCTRLADGGFHVIRFDNRDIGRSSWLDHLGAVDVMQMMMAQAQGQALTAPYYLRDMAADADALLAALGIARAHVVGASMGGMIAQELAINFPARVATLTSIMSSTGRPGLPGPTPEAASVLMRPAPAGLDAYVEGFCQGWEVLRGGSFPEDAARDRDLAARLFARGVNAMGVGRQLAAILASGNREPRLAGVTIPTLVIHGNADPLVPVEAGRATAAAIPGAKLLEIAEMGHAMPRRLQPEIIGAILAHANGG